MRNFMMLLLVALGMAGAVHARNEGVTDTEIHLGASVVLSGPLGPQTVQYTEGSRLLFESVNAKGGVHGRQIRYTTLDDGFDAQTSSNPAAWSISMASGAARPKDFEVTNTFITPPIAQIPRRGKHLRAACNSRRSGCSAPTSHRRERTIDSVGARP